jgi:hypothetical protein
MAETGGYVQDVLTRIVNVQWGGLAVIFGEQDKDAKKPEDASK